MANQRFFQFFKTFHREPILLDCNFVVDPANGNGLGLRNLKGQGFTNVFMNTSASFAGSTHSNLVVDGIASGTATLAVGMPVQGSGIPVGATIASITSSSAITLSVAATTSVAGGTITYQAVGSPNPAAGYIYVQFNDQYFRDYGGFDGAVAPITGSAINISGSAVMTLGVPYVITSIGTSTQANWNAVGLPLGVVPSVGLPFIATATGSGTGTGQVHAVGNSGIMRIEAVGDPSQTVNDPVSAIGPTAQGRGAYYILQCLNGSDAVTAPTTSSVISLKFYLSNSSVVVAGE